MGSQPSPEQKVRTIRLVLTSKKKNETHGEMLDLEKLIFSDHFFTVKMSGKLGLVLARKVVTTYLCTKG